METQEIRRQVRRLFSGGPRTTRIGIEHELIVDDASDGSPVSIERVRSATHDAAYSAHLGFEPGGQVELSLPVAPDPAAAADRLGVAVAALGADCVRAGIRLHVKPVDSRDVEVPLQLAAPRYLAMQEHFDSIGPAGRLMMRRTASTQLCLDWWSGPVGVSQWRLLNLAGPSLAAVFARSSGPASRLATWLAVDPTRTAFDDRLVLEPDPVAAYVDFAATAVPFTTPGDVAQHLTTLFPPVRPRGRYLEVRFLDVQPTSDVALIATVLTTLMYDDDVPYQRTCIAVADDAGRLSERWEQAAHGAPEVIAQGRALVDLALSSARRPVALFDPERAA